jgi:hypothetical protein
MGDITGNQGSGSGSGAVASFYGRSITGQPDDQLARLHVHSNPGRGVSRLYRVTKGKRGAIKRQLLGVRGAKHGKRGAIIGKRARSVGVSGIDAALDRASRLASWLQPMIDPSTSTAFALQAQRLNQFGAVVFLPSQPVLDVTKASARARIVDDLDREHATGRLILSVANWAAHKQARRLFQLRGVTASLTSIDEAASAAVHGILTYSHKLPDGSRVTLARRFNKVQAERWQSPKLINALRLWASRAAFASFSTWANVGTTGDNTINSQSFVGRGFVDEFTTELANQLSMEHWRNDDQLWFEPSKAARWRVVRWVYRIGYRQAVRGLTGLGSGRTRHAALSRCRVLGSLVFGASLVDACAMAGFASVKAWIESCKGAGFFPALRASRQAELVQLPSVRALRASMRGFALQAATATRSMRASAGVWDSASASTLRRVRVRSGASSVQYVPCGYRVTHPASVRSIVGQGVSGSGQAQAGFNWLRACDAREQAIARATMLRGQALDLVASNLAAFDRCMAGLHSDKWGNLRQLFGMVDKRDRVRSRKADASMITRARGKVSRKPKLAQAVLVQVGSRSLACVPCVASQPWASAGELGFHVVKPRA